MTQRDSTLIRVLRTTKASLEQLGRIWAAAHTRGVTGVPEPNEAGIVTIDTVIQELLRKARGKMKRSNPNSGPKTPQAGKRPPLADLGDRAS